MDDQITLVDYEIDFLKQTFKTQDPDEAVEKLVELMVYNGLNPMNLKDYVQVMIKRHQC